MSSSNETRRAAPVVARRAHLLSLGAAVMTLIVGGCTESQQESLPILECTVAGSTTRIEPHSESVIDAGAGELVVDYAAAGGSTELAVTITLHVEGTDYSTLYQIDGTGSQLGEGEFQGGHGFTGLHRLRIEGLDIQYYCTAIPD